ncbi:MAG: Gfo/Idh/MocA family oxidoreductase [Verrucomicrobia bacterium]|nr:Gfo/Idh/MocA family oxidoreductase [Verrucomicrobiota bacterium]
MSSYEKQNVDGKVDRRTFLQSAAVAGASLALSGNALAQAVAQPAKPATVAGPKGIDDLNVGVIGLGAQGQVLIEAASGIPGVRFKAVCDIWEYHQKLVGGRLKKTGHDVKTYEDYRELLAQEKDLDTVIVATPDWMHAEIANACMEAGKHVYCEKEMSNSLEKARSMVATQRKTGKLLQIGHQRRSNPRYIHAIDRLIREANLLGRVTHAYAQWNRSVADSLGWPKKYAIDQAKLDKYGYVSMEQFRNWRWYRKYGGGPIVDLGSHQIDLYSWLWGCNPSAIVAMGGADYYKGREWYDNVMTIYEYHTATPSSARPTHHRGTNTPRKAGSSRSRRRSSRPPPATSRWTCALRPNPASGRSRSNCSSQRTNRTSKTSSTRFAVVPSSTAPAKSPTKPPSRCSRPTTPSLPDASSSSSTTSSRYNHARFHCSLDDRRGRPARRPARSRGRAVGRRSHRAGPPHSAQRSRRRRHRALDVERQAALDEQDLRDVPRLRESLRWLALQLLLRQSSRRPARRAVGSG